jgi:hypothetical protein
MRGSRLAYRGSILILVLAVLAMLAILGAALSRSVHTRSLSAWPARCGGTSHTSHATIGDGANGAPSHKGVHGSQTIPAGSDDRFRCRDDR